VLVVVVMVVVVIFVVGAIRTIILYSHNNDNDSHVMLIRRCRGTLQRMFVIFTQNRIYEILTV